MALAWLSKQWATFRQWLGRTEVPVQLEVVQLGSETRNKNWHTDVLGVRKSTKLQVEYLQHSKLFWVQKSTFSCGLNRTGPTPFSGSKLFDFLRFF